MVDPIGYYSEDDQGRGLKHMAWFHPGFVNPELISFTVAAPVCFWIYDRAKNTVTQEYRDHPIAREKGCVGKTFVWELQDQFDRDGFQLAIWPD
jgi:hypothetical protein